VRQGEIRLLNAVPAGSPPPVLVLSGAAYNLAGKGRVIVCKIVPGSVPEEFTTVHRVVYTGADGTDVIALAVPELIDWFPVSALSEPVGLVRNMRPVLATVGSLFDQ
jgi:hypothetical protein